MMSDELKSMIDDEIYECTDIVSLCETYSAIYEYLGSVLEDHMRYIVSKNKQKEID